MKKSLFHDTLLTLYTAGPSTLTLNILYKALNLNLSHTSEKLGPSHVLQTQAFQDLRPLPGVGPSGTNL